MHRSIGVIGVSRIVRHHADRSAVTVKFRQEPHHRLAVLGVEVTRRLVGQKNGGLAPNCAGYGNALLLTAREL